MKIMCNVKRRIQRFFFRRIENNNYLKWEDKEYVYILVLIT